MEREVGCARGSAVRLTRGEDLRLRRFGTFRSRSKDARPGRNPKIGMPALGALDHGIPIADVRRSHVCCDLRAHAFPRLGREGDRTERRIRAAITLPVGKPSA
ncbi:HU family DNA-binding protein [Methylocapsa aurea]|uniref:HU family DNA-binding protein n=1 Tax=Methylocapsa aurea TaxID=663610 RepID=UPI003D18DB69